MNTKVKISEESLHILIPKDLKQKYQLYCSERDIKFSQRIRRLIEKDLNGEIK